MTIPAVRTDHLALARSLAADPDAWPLAPRFDPRRRWYHRLAVADDHEVWLLTWLPGQGTDLHDHGGSAGAFVVVQGELTEWEAVSPGGDLLGTTLDAGAGRRFGPRHIHQLRNDAQRPAVSLHVYGPALSTMTRYEVTGGELRTVSIDRAGVAW